MQPSEITCAAQRHADGERQNGHAADRAQTKQTDVEQAQRWRGHSAKRQQDQCCRTGQAMQQTNIQRTYQKIAGMSVLVVCSVGQRISRMRRIRMCCLKQWNRPRTRIRNLLRLGVPILKAVTLGRSSKGPYRLAKTYAVQLGLTNSYLTTQGLVSFKELWVKFKYN